MNKVQREFRRQRNEYRKLLEMKAKAGNLSLSEKQEYEQLKRGKYRERLFHLSILDNLSFYSFRLLILAAVVVFSILSGVIGNITGKNFDEDMTEEDAYSVEEEYTDYETTADDQDRETALYELAICHENIDTLFQQAEAAHDEGYSIDVDVLYTIEKIDYVYRGSDMEEIFEAFNNYKESVLKLLKSQYAGIEITEEELNDLKMAVTVNSTTLDQLLMQNDDPEDTYQ